MKNKKLLKTIKTILNVIVITFVLLFVLVVCLQRFSGNKISFFNYRIFTVVTGSMEPKYNIGDVLIAKETKSEDVKVGDAISYLGSSGTFKDKVVTHEVVDIEKDSDGRYIFHTKGIANIVEDPIVYEEQLYGVIKYKATVLSFIYKIVNTQIGMFLFVVIPILYIIGSEAVIALLEKEEKRRSKM